MQSKLSRRILGLPTFAKQLLSSNEQHLSPPISKQKIKKQKKAA
jgi:hypothetical protein